MLAGIKRGTNEAEPPRLSTNLSFVVCCLEFVVCCLLFGVWSLEFGVWSLEFGVWSLEFGVWSLEFGVWSLEFGVWNLEFGIWNLEFGVWRSISFEQLVLRSVAHQLDAAVQAQLVHQVRAVALDRAHAQIQRLRNLRVRNPACDEPQHLDLARTERFRADCSTSRGLRRVGQQGAGQSGVDVQVAARDGADGVDQLRLGGALRDVSRRAGADRLAQQALVFVSGEDQDASIGQQFLQPPRRLDASAGTGHADVHQHDVRAQHARQAHGLVAIGCLADDLQIGLGIQERAQARAQDAVIIRDENPNRHKASPDR